MAAPLRPQRPLPRDEPCSLCGAQVVLRQVELSPRGGDTEPEYADQPTCTNPRCDNNAPGPGRRMGDTP